MNEGIFIFGLGNPGNQYRFSRHNFGFIAVDKFARENNFPDFRKKKEYEVSEKIFGERKVCLVKPLTYMNLSGRAVKEVLNKNGIFSFSDAGADSNILLVHDDLDLSFGRIKIKFAGSGGSHNGVNSVIEHLKSKNFVRLKLGINSPERDRYKTGADFVLSNFSGKETEMLPEILEKTNSIMELFISEGLASSMNKFNKK